MPLVLDVALWRDGSDLLLNVVSTVGIVIGGVWAFMKFVWGRTFRERLEASVNGEVEAKGGPAFVHAVIKVSNVGLAKVPLRQVGSGLRLFSSSRPSDDEVGAKWSRVTTVGVLGGHNWIEPGETIHNHVLLALPEDMTTPWQLELHLVSDKHSWVARCIGFHPLMNQEHD